MAASLAALSPGAALAIGAADLQALEDRFERRFAELELRHQRHLDSLSAKIGKDSTQMEEALSLAKRCEHDIEVVSEWQRDATAQLATATATHQKNEEALNAARLFWQSAVDEMRQNAEATGASHNAMQESLQVLAVQVHDLSAARKGSLESLGNCEGDGGDAVDVQDLFSRSPWAKSLDRQVFRAAEQVKQAHCQIEALEALTTTLERKLNDEHADVRELHARWGADAAERAESMQRNELHITEFSNSYETLATDVRSSADLQKQQLQKLFEEQLALALKDVEPCNAACASLHEALESQMTQLHGERAAMRRAWDRVEALRKDDTWGFFLRNDQEQVEWRSDISRRLSELEDEVTQGSNSVWPEIGHLGCRVADLHAVLDERVPPKDGSKSTASLRNGAQRAATPGRAAGSGAARKPARQGRSPERLISAKPAAPSGSTDARRTTSVVKGMERALAARPSPLPRSPTRKPQDEDSEPEAGRHDASAASRSAAGKRDITKSQAISSVADAEMEHASNSSSANTSARTNTPPRKVRSGVSPDRRVAGLQTGSKRPSPPRTAVSRVSRRSVIDEDLSGLVPDTA